jgi:CheY-like chemotaxis protein
MNEQETILLVDDSEDALILMREGFRQANSTHPLQQVYDGEEALAYLKGEGSYADRGKFPMPVAVLLDLNMPKMNGCDVLTAVRALPGFKHLAIFVLTASMRDADVERAYYFGATAFLVKPGSLEKLAAMAQCICDWLQINYFPPVHEAGREAEADAGNVQSRTGRVSISGNPIGDER